MTKYKVEIYYHEEANIGIAKMVKKGWRPISVGLEQYKVAILYRGKVPPMKKVV